MRARIVILLVGLGALAVGCNSKSKCADGAIGDIIDGAAPSTVQALERAMQAQAGRACATVDLGNEQKVPGSILFAGTMPTAWRAIEDELLKEGWERADQTKEPKADDTLFQVSYRQKGRPKGEWRNAPRLELQLYTGDSCGFGDVCVRGRQLGEGRQN